ncbi:hypothetical protein [Micromonospora echinofusca]|uniref:XRE family transcriptional regulator n=1 Tax=Micromonospora echinofusca TaxID=47858 RepID=A0ABS3VZ15_MICEH|nr:hypothetical protein [Micromonospora echinofusca]MBO4209780.1 hypothetical protein [Micromonospora echinofusca]
MSRAQLMFGPALRAAISDSGLTLKAVQSRLARRGVQVAVPTLSSWQIGTNRPERPESLRAVAVLEEIFELSPGSLTALLGPPRPRGRTALRGDRRRFDGIPGAPAVAEIVEEICPALRNDVRVLYTEEEVVLRSGRLLSEIRTRFLGEACLDGVDRCFSVNYAEPGHDLDAVRTVAVRHCRLGRVRRRHEQRLIASELLLDHAYRVGETFMIEYSSVINQPVFDAEYFRAFNAPVGLYVLQVRFDPTELPVRCYQFRSTGPEQTRSELEIRLSSTWSALLSTQSPGRGVQGIRWEWE